jgi:hypothetical protein
VRVDEKSNANNAKRIEQAMQPEEEEYDPRKHRIYRGVRKTSMDWIGNGVKIGQAVGTKLKK